MNLASSNIPAIQRVNRAIARPGRRVADQLGNRLRLLAYRLRIYLAETLPRLFDINCAGSAILLLSPLLLVRALLARLQQGRVFDRHAMQGRDAARFDMLEFAGHYPGRSLAVLFNILKGDLSLTGPRARTPDEVAQDSGASMAVRHVVRPGMISPFSMRRRVGIAHDAEAETDSEFVYTQTAGGSVTLLLRALLGRLITGDSGRPTPATLRFFDVDMANTTMDETLAWLSGRARERKPEKPGLEEKNS